MKTVKKWYIVIFISLCGTVFSQESFEDAALKDQIAEEFNAILPLKFSHKAEFEKAEKLLYEKYTKQNNVSAYLVVKTEILDRLRSIPVNPSYPVRFNSLDYLSDSAIPSRAPSQMSSRSPSRSESANNFSSLASFQLPSRFAPGADHSSTTSSLIFSPATLFNPEQKMQEMREMRTSGEGRINSYQNSEVNWVEVKFPIFSDSNLLQIYTLLYALANCDDTMQALLNTLNNSTVMNSQHVNYDSLSPRLIINKLIGLRARDEIKNYKGLNQQKIQLLDKYFSYTMATPVDEQEPFSLEELMQFRDEARKIEAISSSYGTMIKNAAKVNATALGLAGITAAGVAYYQGKFDPAINAVQNFVYQTMPHVTQWASTYVNNTWQQMTLGQMRIPTLDLASGSGDSVTTTLRAGGKAAVMPALTRMFSTFPNNYATN